MKPRWPFVRDMQMCLAEAEWKLRDMTNQSIATALPLGLLAFTLSVLPVTTAEAECYWAAQCREGDRETGRVTRFGTGILGGKELRSECCTTPSEPYATGETESERQKRFARECAEQGKSYYPQWGKCVSPGDQLPVIEGTTSGGRRAVLFRCDQRALKALSGAKVRISA
jgi:hypothetical protein